MSVTSVVKLKMSCTVNSVPLISFLRITWQSDPSNNDDKCLREHKSDDDV